MISSDATLTEMASAPGLLVSPVALRALDALHLTLAVRDAASAQSLFVAPEQLV